MYLSVWIAVQLFVPFELFIIESERLFATARRWLLDLNTRLYPRGLGFENPSKSLGIK